LSRFDAEPRGEYGVDAEDAAAGESDRADESRELGVKYNRAPQHDDERAVFLRVPAPEAAPRLVGPYAAEHGAEKRADDAEAERAIDGGLRFAQHGIVRDARERLHKIHRAEQAGYAGAGVADGMQTTCVASQKLLSSTATMTPIVSPSAAKRAEVISSARPAAEKQAGRGGCVEPFDGEAKHATDPRDKK